MLLDQLYQSFKHPTLDRILKTQIACSISSKHEIVLSSLDSMNNKIRVHMRLCSTRGLPRLRDWVSSHLVCNPLSSPYLDGLADTPLGMHRAEESLWQKGVRVLSSDASKDATARAPLTTTTTKVVKKHPRFTYDGKSLRDAMKHCVDMVQERDYEFYQWCSQLPLKKHRAPVFVLKALALEIESIQLQARTEMLLKMRYQWWRDSVGKAFAATQSYEMSQPVMKALSELIQCHDISRHRVDAMIDAYEEDALRTRHFGSIEELEDYAQRTVSHLLSLQLEACGMKSNATEHAAMSHLGKAIGLVSSLRGAEAALRRGKSYFPEDICQRFDATPTDFLVNGGQSVLPDIAREIATVAKQHIESSKSLGHETVFRIQALSTEMYLDALEKANFDIFSSNMHRNGYLPIEYLLRMKWRFIMT